MNGRNWHVSNSQTLSQRMTVGRSAAIESAHKAGAASIGSTGVVLGVGPRSMGRRGQTHVRRGLSLARAWTVALLMFGGFGEVARTHWLLDNPCDGECPDIVCQGEWTVGDPVIGSLCGTPCNQQNQVCDHDGSGGSMTVIVCELIDLVAGGCDYDECYIGEGAPPFTPDLMTFTWWVEGDDCGELIVSPEDCTKATFKVYRLGVCTVKVKIDDRFCWFNDDFITRSIGITVEECIEDTDLQLDRVHLCPEETTIATLLQACICSQQDPPPPIEWSVRPKSGPDALGVRLVAIPPEE